MCAAPIRSQEETPEHPSFGEGEDAEQRAHREQGVNAPKLAQLGQPRGSKVNKHGGHDQDACFPEHTGPPQQQSE